MLKSIAVKNFRGIRALTLAPLAQVNLFVGEQNVGKTSLLEALFVRFGHHLPDVGIRLSSFRGMNYIPGRPEDLWGWLFYGREWREPASIATESRDGTRKEVRVRMMFPEARTVMLPEAAGAREPSGAGTLETAARPEYVCELVEGDRVLKEARAALREDGLLQFEGTQSSGETRAVFLFPTLVSAPENAERLSALDRAHRLGAVVESLKAFEPRVERVAAGVLGGRPVVYVDVGLSEMIPAWLLGGGFQRLLTLLLAISDFSGAAILVDEIENGLYSARFTHVWRAVRRAVEAERAQLFATTHSLECLRAAQEAFSGAEPEAFAVHRLERQEGDEIGAVTFDAKSLGVALERNWEVR